MPAALTPFVTEVLNGTVEAVKTIIPGQHARERAMLVSGPVVETEIGVVIGLAGESQGRLVVDGHVGVFTEIAQRVFGISVDGELLASCVGEIGNIIAGSMSAHVSGTGIRIHPSPPTVFVGPTSVDGFEQAISVPLHIDGIGQIRSMLILENGAAW